MTVDERPAVPKRFRLLSRAGAGGMGVVWKAEDRELARIVALKVMHTADEADARRFARERELLATLSNPHIVRYLDHGLLRDGRPWLAMEWLEGAELSAVLRTRLFGVGECVRFGLSLLSGLAAAHALGIIHRDVKPTNIFLVDGAAARPKLLDFGIARRIRESSLTAEGTVLGTFGFAAPEQLESGEIDERADLYSLGCVLFTCLVGRPPDPSPPSAEGGGASHDVLGLAQLRPDLPSRLLSIIGQLVARDPALRPASARAVIEDLQPLLTDDGQRTDRARAILTYDERRLRTALVGLASQQYLADEATVDLAGAASGASPRGSELATYAAELGLELERGAAMFWMTAPHSESSTAEAQRLALAALALRSRLPNHSLVLLSALLHTADARSVADLVRDVPRSSDGEIFVLPDTASLLGTQFVLTPRAGGFVLQRDEQPRVAGKAVPFVGRRFELDVLVRAFDEMSTVLAAQALVISAPAGLGKSRLCLEALARMRQRGVAHEQWAGRLDSLDRGVSLGIIRSIARAIIGASVDEPIREQERKLRERLQRRIPAARATAVFETLGDALGLRSAPSVPAGPLRSDPALLAHDLREAWTSWIVAEANVAPIVLLLEDLQWADAASLHLVERTLTAARDLPLLVVGTTRTEAQPTIAAALARHGITELRLQPLRAREAEQLVSAVLGLDLDPERLRSVLAKADGNPLYLEELLRAATAAAWTLPASLLGMLQARIAQLDGDGRLILRAASVLGDRFSQGGVQHVAAGQAVDVGAWLRHATEQELLVCHSDSGPPATHVFGFRHALVREAAYAMLVEHDRVLAHARAGEWLAKQGGVPPAILAGHFDRGELYERAAVQYLFAAEEALAGNDLAGALGHADAATRAGLSGALLARLRQLQSAIYRWQGDFQRARQIASEAITLVGDASVGVEWLRAATELVEVSTALADYPRVVELADALAAVPSTPTHRPERLACLSATITGLLNGGNIRRALTLAEELEPLDDELAALPAAVRGMVRRTRAYVARHRGTFEREHREFVAAEAAFTEDGDLRAALGCRLGIGFSYLELGRYDEAQTELDQVRVVAARYQLDAVVTRADHNAAMVACARGEFVRAIALESAAIAAAEAQGQARLHAWALVYLALIHHRAGDWRASRDVARRVAQVDKAPPAVVAGGAAQQSRAELKLGNRAEALALSTAAFALLQSLEWVEEFDPLIRLAHAEALEANGKTRDAKLVMTAARAEVKRRAATIMNKEWRASFVARDEIVVAIGASGKKRA